MVVVVFWVAWMRIFTSGGFCGDGVTEGMVADGLRECAPAEVRGTETAAVGKSAAQRPVPAHSTAMAAPAAAAMAASAASVRTAATSGTGAAACAGSRRACCKDGARGAERNDDDEN